MHEDDSKDLNDTIEDECSIVQHVQSVSDKVLMGDSESEGIDIESPAR